MIRFHNLNAEQSLEAYTKASGFMEMKQCYCNVFYVPHFFGKKFLSGEWRVAYGYMSSVQHYMVRHCFIVNKKGEAIDPTRHTTTRLIDDRMYVSFYVFDTYKEYVEAVSANDGVPDLLGVLDEYERGLFEEWAPENGKVLMRG